MSGTGERMLVFDASHWFLVGHDVGDNSCFWKPARIVRRYRDSWGEELADVVFGPRISKGHIVDCMRPLPPSGEVTGEQA